MQDINDKINNMHMGKLIHMLSHEMKRNQPIDKVIKADLTIMQKHILKFILLETMHKDLYQKDIEDLRSGEPFNWTYTDTKYESLEINVRIYNSESQ